MLVGPCAGEKVCDAKAKIKQELSDRGEAMPYFEPESLVLSRCGAAATAAAAAAAACACFALVSIGGTRVVGAAGAAASIVVLLLFPSVQARSPCANRVCYNLGMTMYVVSWTTCRTLC